jgi:hypothetical protein
MNIHQFTSNLFTSVPTRSTKRPSTPVGAGYYALQLNISAAGITYTNLVKADTSNLLQTKPFGKDVLKPLIGSRTDRPSRHRARSVKL